MGETEPQLAICCSDEASNPRRGFHLTELLAKRLPWEYSNKTRFLQVYRLTSTN